MFLENLKLENFRNYNRKEFNFGETNLIIGPNTSGKTNLLESIYFLCFGKSFRADQDGEAIAYEKPFARISGSLSPHTPHEPHTPQTFLEIFLERTGETHTKKIFKVNNLPRLRKVFTQNLTGVLFKPQDLEIMDGSPSLRRSFLNEAVISAKPEFASTIASYEILVRNRNRLLERIRDGVESKENLSFWNSRLLELAEKIEKERETFVAFAKNFLPTFSRDFSILSSPRSNESSSPHFIYTTKALSSKILSEFESLEIASAQTLHGPHKADFKIIFGGRDMSHFGSRGQQRTLVLGLKLAQLEYSAATFGTRPLLLLDDIFSELDEPSRHAVQNILGKQQTFITTTEPDSIAKNPQNLVITQINLTL